MDTLSVENINKVYTLNRGKILTAVQDVSFTIHPGETLAIMGPSGCGKSTLLRICAGLEHPTSGKVYVNNREVTYPGRDRGVFFQQYTLFPWLSVLANVEFGLRYRPDVDSKDRRKIGGEFLHLVGLTGFESLRVSQLSGGMQQRVALARTLAADPAILLADEPFSALDTLSREALQLSLIETQKIKPRPTLLVTHDVEEAVFVADRVIVFTSRPARQKREFQIDLPKPRSLLTKDTLPFTNLKRQILQSIRNEMNQASAQ